MAKNWLITTNSYELQQETYFPLPTQEQQAYFRYQLICFLISVVAAGASMIWIATYFGLKGLYHEIF
jgi:hypothetical protein